MNNQEIGKRIKRAREMRNETLESVAQEVGVARSTIQRYENGKIEKIKLPVLESIAKALDVSPAWLSCKTDDMKNNHLSVTNIYPIELKKFPLLGEIACGKPNFANEDRESYVMAGTDIQADFCLIAKGDSMINARIHDGDVVFIRKQEMVENGEIAAVIIDNDATLKRVYYYRDKNLLVLKPENPAYEDIVYQDEQLNDVHILGKAVAFQSDVV